MLMKKKIYEKPSMKVYELNQQPQILVGSNSDAGLQDYNWNNVNPE